jgi:hypothetical protein
MSANRKARNLTAAVLWTGLAGLAVSVSACGSAGAVFGSNKLAPDEFRVVTKAPLVVPPDYALRPPAPGEPRPQELQPESQARVALLGQRDAILRDDAEKSFADRAGAEKADPLIRYMLDDQYGDIAHKDKSFADRVMFWRKGDPANAQLASNAAAADTPAPLDPAASDAKIKGLTGGKEIIIQRAPEKKKFKLPGL